MYFVYENFISLYATNLQKQYNKILNFKHITQYFSVTNMYGSDKNNKYQVR